MELGATVKREPATIVIRRTHVKGKPNGAYTQTIFARA
jgi:hypothetical protein